MSEKENKQESMQWKGINITHQWKPIIERLDAKFSREEAIVHAAEIECDIEQIKEIGALVSKRFEELAKVMPRPAQVKLLLAHLLKAYETGKINKESYFEENKRLDRLCVLSGLMMKESTLRPLQKSEDATKVE